MKLSLADLVALAERHGFPDPELAAAVAMAESGGNPAVIRDTTHETLLAPGIGPERSIGLWQINVHTNANPQYASWPLTDPDTNAKAAYEISKQGTSWTPWSTYTSGLYLQYYKPAASFPRVTLPEVTITSSSSPSSSGVLLLALAALAFYKR